MKSGINSLDRRKKESEMNSYAKNQPQDVDSVKVFVFSLLCLVFGAAGSSILDLGNMGIPNARPGSGKGTC